jgi:hypothetical protein
VNGLQNNYMATFFGSFGTKSLSGGGKFVHNIYGNPNFLGVDKLFFPNSYKLHYLYILMDFYLVLLRKVCPRSFQSYGCSVKCPSIIRGHPSSLGHESIEIELLNKASPLLAI